MEIYELVYYSIASPSLTRDDISEILELSHKNNPKADLTGCLLYHGDAFIQILEGEQEIIESLFLKIEHDKRHYNVRLVFDGKKKERLFKNWSMAFFDLSKDGSVDKDKLMNREAFMAIANQTEYATDASELFCSISNQIIKQ